jgi:mannose-6-phosphate isomerase-like protein (cupin superfamily)
MQAFELSQLLSVSERTDVRYTEFLRHPSLSVGLYTLPAGSIDPQQPHAEDEVYYIVSGQGVIKVGNETRAVQEGSVIFVAAGASHHFHSITANLTILVFFAPAEYTLAAKSEG